MSIYTNNPSLIRLRNIREDRINHGDKHTVFERVARVLDDWNDVCAVCGHVNEISSGSMREFDCEDCACRPNDIRNV